MIKYPFGHGLTQAEGKLADTHAPRDAASGKALCWGYLTHQGCNLMDADCTRKHSHLKDGKGLSSLHYCVALQILRRGG